MECAALHSNVMHCFHMQCMHYCTSICNALHCSALHAIARHYAALDGLHCTAFVACAAFRCNALHCIALHSDALQASALQASALYCTALLYTTAHYCKKPDDFFFRRYPLLYTPGPANRFFNMRVFAHSLMHGIFTSLSLVFVAKWTSIDTVDNHGRNNDDLSTFGFTVLSSLVVSVTGQVAMDTSYWTYINFLSIIFSLFFLFAVSIGYFEWFPYDWILKMGYGSTYGSALVAWSTSVYWFNILLVSVVTLLPVVSNEKKLLQIKIVC